MLKKEAKKVDQPTEKAQEVSSIVPAAAGLA